MAKRGRGRPRKIISDNLNDGPDRAQPTEKSDEKDSYSDELPEFFKVYKPALCAESMKIPPDFIKKFGQNIPTSVTLRRQSGQSWQVDIKRINDNWFFRECWPEFVQENSLEDDDFLTFCYIGNSVFCVKIFTRNGCIKRDDCTNGKPIENLHGNEVSEHVYAGNYEENHAIGRNLSQETSITGKTMYRNLSFSVVLTRSYICKGSLHSPRECGRIYVTKCKDGPRTVTLWIKNNSWAVSLIIIVDRLHFRRGWPKFVKDNSLQNGNLCIFKLID
ncbi:hypothetical protein CDL12_17589 [Handroanthus impetiginosus]|uniref:TF-B3 domain-containing protein n=1 Tax=Handroanthus impetiginosus TaxID=429701 RepID=A0A2G9GXA9_9LAMI|nr:hypothetical protein CDL12_17589 [Handroanthus impetiginosus]